MARSKNRALDSEFEKVKAQVLSLSPNSRALAQILLESLEELMEAEDESLWLAEAEGQRQVREGRVQFVSGDEAKDLLDSPSIHTTSKESAFNSK